MALELVKDFRSIGSNVINSIELSPDERLLAVASCDAGKVCVYDTSSGERKWSTNLHSFQAVFSPDDTQLAVADAFGKCVEIFVSETGVLLRTLSGHTLYVRGVAWSSTGIIASASHDFTVRLWNPDDGTCLRTLSGHSNIVYVVSFSPDGTQLASGGRDNTVRIWDVASGTCLHTLTGHKEAVWCVAFSPDGSKLASTSCDDTVRIWDASSNFNLIQSLAGADVGTWPTIAWTHDSRILASANETTLQLWDQSGASILLVQNQASAVAIPRFSCDIITGNIAGQISRWKSPVIWSLLLGIPFGKLPLPFKSTHDVSGTLERISTIIERMDPPVAFHQQIKSLHDLNNPIFIDIEKKAKIAGEIEQCFSDLINQRQSLREAHESLQIKAHQRIPVNDVKQDLSSIDSSVRSISEAMPIINRHLQEYAAIKPSSDTPSLKQYEHPAPKELSAKELDVILAFTRKSRAKLVQLGQVVVDTATKFESALLQYDQYSAEIREQSEKNLNAVNAFLALLTRPSMSSERIQEIEATLSELQAKLDNENKIIRDLGQSLSEICQIKGRLNQMIEAERQKEKEEADLVELKQVFDLTQSQKGDHRKSLLEHKEKEIATSNAKLQQLSSQLGIDRNDHLDQKLEQAKSHLKSVSGIAHNPHLVYKWFREHPDFELDAGEVFDIIGIR